MTQQGLNDDEFGAGLEQMRGEAMSEHVRCAGTRDPGIKGGLRQRAASRARVQRLGCGRPCREQPGSRPLLEPVVPQFLEQSRREQREAFAVPFAVSDAYDVLLGIDVGDLESAGFVDTQSRGIAGHE